MKILYLANAYPTKKNPYYGIYIKEQYEYIQENFNLESKLFVLNGENGFKKYFKPLKIFNIIRNYNPDIIHIHYGLTGIPILLIYPFIFKRKIVSTFHGSDINAGGIVTILSKILASISTKNIAVSKEIYEKLGKYKNKTVHIPCGVDPLFFDKDESIERKNKIIFSGHPDRMVKNYKLFQEVIEVLKRKYNEKPEIVIFDNKSREEVKKSLLTSKCLVITSISEGSPQVVKEAIVCNLPIVSTSVGDIPYLLEGLENCYVANDSNTLAEKVYRVLTSEYKLFPDTVKTSLGNSEVCNEIAELYKKLE